MSDPLGQYVAAYQLQNKTGGTGFGFSETPPASIKFLQRLGVYHPQVVGRGVSLPPTLQQLPMPVLSLLNDAIPSVDKLGPDFDYQRLAQLAEEHADKLPPEAYSRMAATAMVGLGRQQTKGAVAGQEFLRIGSSETLRQATFGLSGPSLEARTHWSHDLFRSQQGDLASETRTAHTPDSPAGEGH